MKKYFYATSIVFLIFFSLSGFGQTLLIDVGSANNFVVNYPANLAATVPGGFMFTFKSSQNISGSATLNLNSTSAIPVVKSFNQPLVANDVKAGHFVTVIYDGTNWQMLNVAANPVGSGTVTNVTGTLPISVATGTTTPSISIAQANGAINGYLSSTDWTTFNNKLANGSAASGDLSGSFPSPIVVKLQGNNVANTAPTNGQTLTWNNGLSRWEPQTVAASGTAGGDLSGTYPNPTVAKINGTGVTASIPSFGQFLYYNGTFWTPGSIGGDLAGSFPNPTVAKINGTSVSATAPSNGQFLYYNGALWSPGSIAGDLTGSFPNPTVANLAITTAKLAPSSVDLTTKVTGTLPTSNGGTGTNTAFTNGSVVFAGPTGNYTQNSNFFWDNTNSRLGIGTNIPATALHIVGNARISGLIGPGLVQADATGNLSINATSYVTSAAANNSLPYMVGGTLQTSPVKSDGTYVSIGIAPQTNYLFQVQAATTFPAIYGTSSIASGSAIWGYNNNVTAGSIGVVGVGTGGGTGVKGSTSGAGYGVYGTNAGTGPGGYFENTAAGPAILVPTGNVGIGNATPAAKLDISVIAAGPSTALNVSTSYNSANGVGIYVSANTGLTASITATAISGNASGAGTSGTSGYGISGSSQNNVTNYGVSGQTLGSTGTTSYGLYGSSGVSAGDNYGLFAQATGGGTNNFALYANVAGSATNKYAGVFMGGNVGIGVPAPAFTLHSRAAAIASTAEIIASFEVSDGGGSYVQLGNYSNVNAIMEPSIRGNMIGSNNSFVIEGVTNNDAAGGPMILLNSKFTSAALTAKPLFGIANNGTMKMLMDATGNVGIGTITPAANLDINGTLKVGSTGNVINGIIKFASLTSTAVGSITAGSTGTVTLTAANVLAGDIILITQISNSLAATNKVVVERAVAAANLITITLRNTDTATYSSAGTIIFSVVCVK